MPKPWVPYVIQQGDHLDKLAYRFGTDPDTIWSDAKNKDLAARRKNRDTLSPGDVLYVPSEPAPGLDLEVGTKNSYRAEVPKVPVKLYVVSKRRPVEDKAFEVHGAGGEEALQGKVSGEGEIAFEVPVWVREVEVRIPEVGMIIPVHVGDLDPIDEDSGVTQRLRSLGYLPPSGPSGEESRGRAIRTFQRDKKLPMTGVVDDETRKKLEQAHKS